MGICSAPKCHNSHEKGYRTYKFPTDPVRRQIWTKRMNRTGWQPSTSSRLCDIHFPKDAFQFKGTLIGLKKDALPVFFGFLKGLERGLELFLAEKVKNNGVRLVVQDHCYAAQVREPVPKVDPAVALAGHDYDAERSDDEDDDDRSSGDVAIVTVDDLSRDAVAELESIDHEYHQLHLKVPVLEKTIRAQERFIRELQSTQEPAFFRKDQKLYLKNGSMHGHRWTTDTLVDGFKLYFSCGKSGYNQIRKMGYPLPSIRTLQENVEQCFEGDNLEDVFGPMKTKNGAMKKPEKLAELLAGDMSSSQIDDNDDD